MITKKIHNLCLKVRINKIWEFTVIGHIRFFFVVAKQIFIELERLHLDFLLTIYHFKNSLGI